MVVAGEKFVLSEGIPSTPRIGGYGRASFPEGSIVEISRVNTETYWVRGEARTTYGVETASVAVEIANFGKYVTPVDPNAPKPRKLGEVPDGDYISPDDPRLAWLWEDAAKLATKRGYCSQYDAIADALDIPGRERNISIKKTVNGIEMSLKIKARSKKEAEQLFYEAINSAAKEISDGR